MTETALQIDNLSVYYGDEAALSNVCLEVAHGENPGHHRAERRREVDFAEGHPRIDPTHKRQRPHLRPGTRQEPGCGRLRSAIRGDGRSASRSPCSKSS